MASPFTRIKAILLGRQSDTAGHGDADHAALQHIWLSPWTGWVGLRYLRSKKHSRFLSFITLLSVLGVGLGVTAMIVVLSVMDGFESELKKRMYASDLHVLIQPLKEVPGFDSGLVPKGALSDEKIELLKRSPKLAPVLHVWPVTATEAILKAGRRVKGISLKGITQERFKHLLPQVVETRKDQRLDSQDEVKPQPSEHGLHGLYMGQELAYEMRVLPGDEVTLISPLEAEGPLNAVPRLRRYVVEGLYHSGHPEQELQMVYTSQKAVWSFMRRSDVVSQWELTVDDFDKAPMVAHALRENLSGFLVQDWMQLNAHLFASLQLERVSMFVILAFIIVVASFNIVTTLTLMVLEKKREIAILKAMGARHGQVAAIFLSEGILIGTLGVGGGALFGLAICSLLRRYEFIQLPDIYYDRTLPVSFDPKYYILVSLCALLIVLAACLYPSRRAARLHPLEGIRFGS